jgi:hypothetical protein
VRFDVAIGSYSFFDPEHGPNTNVVLRVRDAQKLAQVKRAVDDMLESAASTIKYCLSFALSRRKQGFESPRERQWDQRLIPKPSVGVQQLSDKRLRTSMDFDDRKSCACVRTA